MSLILGIHWSQIDSPEQKNCIFTVKDITGRYLIVSVSSAIGQAIGALLQKNGHEVLTIARNTAKINPDFMMNATNTGVIGLVKLAAATYASLNLRSNVIAAGMLNTPLTEPLLSNQPIAELYARIGLNWRAPNN